jgi:hypothetical protein
MSDQPLDGIDGGADGTFNYTPALDYTPGPGDPNYIFVLDELNYTPGPGDPNYTPVLDYPPGPGDLNYTPGPGDPNYTPVLNYTPGPLTITPTAGAPSAPSPNQTGNLDVFGGPGPVLQGSIESGFHVAAPPSPPSVPSFTPSPGLDSFTGRPPADPYNPQLVANSSDISGTPTADSSQQQSGNGQTGNGPYGVPDAGVRQPDPANAGYQYSPPPLSPPPPLAGTGMAEPDITRVPSYLSTLGSLLDQQIRYTYAPRDVSGNLLQGPLNLYSETQAQISAMNAPGYTVGRTIYAQSAAAQEAALRGQLGIPTGNLPGGPYNDIWGTASYMAVRDAALASSVATHNDLNTLRRDSIQALYELPTLKKYGGGMGGLGLVTGGLSIYGGIEEQDPTLSGLAIGGGSLESLGGGMVLVGAMRTSAPLMSYGRFFGTAGAVVAAPVVISHAYDDITSDDPLRQWLGGLDAVGLVFFPAAFLSLYERLFVIPAGTEFYEISRRDIADMMHVPRSWIY